MQAYPVYGMSPDAANPVYFYLSSYNKRPIFARSCRSAQSGCPAAPREVVLPLLPHGPGGVRRHLPRRTRLRRSAGPEENRPVHLNPSWEASSGALPPNRTKQLYSYHDALSRNVLPDQQAILLFDSRWNHGRIGQNRRCQCAGAVASIGTTIGGDFPGNSA